MQNVTNLVDQTKEEPQFTLPISFLFVFFFCLGPVFFRITHGIAQIVQSVLMYIRSL